MRQQLPWQDPVALFRAVAARGEDIAFLHSSLATSYSGGRSWLAFDAGERCQSGDWEEIAAFVSQHARQAAPSVFGYLGYEMTRDWSGRSAAEASPIPMPPSGLVHFRQVVEWDHVAGTMWRHGGGDALPESDGAIGVLPQVAELGSNMDRARYLALVAATREAIARGDFYQANITRKFYGRFAEAPDPLGLHASLLAASPAPYSAFLRMGETVILSSSPERFLSVDPSGLIAARPIKGTRRRQEHESAEEARAMLAASPKDRAENLMIVDLMRNDLARVAVPGSVTAERLFETDSFATLHHLSSTIEGQLRPECNPLDAVRAAFPPGSMTGAPKIAAIDWCAQIEGMARGVYSGALGWFAGNACELSVVIRTLVLCGDRFEFQVGGGIVHDSEPEAEWRETLTKARGIAACLGISEGALEAL